MIKLLILLFTFSFPAIAKDNADICEGISDKDLTEGLESRYYAASETQKNLRILLDGTQLLQLPTSELFSIDLDNDDAVIQKLSELEGFASQDSQVQVPDDFFITCALAANGTAEKILALQTIEQENIRLRFSFLSLAPKKRQELLEFQKTGVDQRQQEQKLVIEIDTAEQEIKKAAESIAKAEEDARLTTDQFQKELANHKAVLEKVRKDIAEARIAHSTTIKNHGFFHRLTSENLAKLAAKLITGETNLTSSELKIYFLEVNDYWRILVDRTFSEIDLTVDRSINLPELPELPVKILQELKGQQEADDYKETFESVAAMRSEFLTKRAERIEELRNNHYRMLLQSSRLRSKYLELTLEAGDTSLLRLSDEYFLDLWREIRVVPHRGLEMFYGVLLDVRARFTGGVAGIVSLMRDAVLLFFFVAIPISVFLGLKRLIDRIDHFRAKLVRFGEPYTWRSALAIWLKKLSPFLPWMLMLFGFWIAKSLLSNSGLENIRDVFSYVEYYIWYRLFKLFVALTLSRAAYSSSLRGLSDLRARIERTTKFVSVFFFVAFVILRITEATVGVALVYRLVSSTTIYIGWGVLAWCAWTWRDQICLACKDNFSAKTSEKIERWCSSKWSGLIVCFPLVCILTVIAVSRRVNRWVSNFEFYKKISVEILKRKLEVNEQDDEEDSAKNRYRVSRNRYLEFFTLSVPDEPSQIIQPAHKIGTKVAEIILSWSVGESEETSLALYGEKGVGKSTLLQTLKDKFPKVLVKTIVVPAKLFNIEKVTEFFNEHIAELDSKKKTLVIVDDAHNLFLSELGGFEGYKRFLDIINQGDKDTFWCVAYNKRAWKFLDYVLDRNQFYRNIVELSRFSDVDIQNMIMTRHQQSGFELEFDEMILAASKSDFLTGSMHAETQFFTLLWGLAKGNPRTALSLWKASVSMVSPRKIIVGIPKPLVLRGLNSLNEGDFFVYGAILTHENLSVSEAVRTTNLPAGIVRNALKVGEDIDALEKSQDGRYRVNPLAQSRLIHFLLEKNIVYE